jgi:hypothetical protein
MYFKRSGMQSRGRISVLHDAGGSAPGADGRDDNSGELHLGVVGKQFDDNLQAKSETLTVR